MMRSLDQSYTKLPQKRDVHILHTLQIYNMHGKNKNKNLFYIQFNGCKYTDMIQNCYQ